MVEMASRELCRRKLLPFIQRFRPDYEAGWVHEDICRRLERFVRQVEEKKSPRLLLMMPYRHGKSEIASRHFAPWVFGQHPNWEIIAASNAQSLATSFSRYVRDVLRDPGYASVFPETRLDPSSQAAESWSTTKGGGYLAAGIGTAIIGRGAHCFPSGTRVLTSSGYAKIEHLVIGDEVLGYDHAAKRIKRTKVEARRVVQRSDLVEIFTRSGRRIVATGDHPFFVVGKGYRAAEILERGARLLIADVSTLREAEAENREAVSGLLPERTEGVCRTVVRALRKIVSKTALRLQKSDRPWTQRPLLLGGLLASTPCGQECQSMQSLWRSGNTARALSRGDVLLGGLPKNGLAEAAERGLLPGVWENLRSALINNAVLLGEMFKRCAQRANARRGKPELQGRGELQHTVSEDAPANSSKGREAVRHLRREDGAGCSPHRPFCDEQCAGKPDYSVQELPRELPSVGFDLVHCVRPLRSGSVEVYDIQVADTSNFFAEEILVHNCLIIDDPVRDAEAADSQVIRDNTWEWYITTAKSRLSPGGGVLGIMTCWNDDDWGGRVQLAAAAGGDQFEIVRYPAINDQGDEYILTDDSIVQIPPDTPVPAGSRLTRRINSPLHPARYTLDMLKAIKASYYALGNQRWWSAGYQQNPTPDEGLVFTKDMFRYYGTAPARSDMYVYQAWDFAISEGKEADYTVGVCIGVDHRDNVYVLDLRRFKSQDAFIIVDTMLDFACQYDATLGVEDGQIWKAIESQFKKRCEERRQYPSYEVLKPLTDKLVRANPLRGRMQLGKVYFDKDATWFGEMHRELLHFPAGKHDDQIDALAWAVRLTLGRAAPRQQVPKIHLKSWKDELPGLVGKRGGSFMAA